MLRFIFSHCLVFFYFAFIAHTTVLANVVETETQIIPLPVYATLPNEGDTFGFMPVFLVVEKQDQRTQSIFAPSYTWNKLIRHTGTFRWFYYPSQTATLTFITSLSSNINKNLTLEYFDVKREKGFTLDRLSWQTTAHLRRSVFSRFFGLGPESKTANESSYTIVGGDVGLRVGTNLTDNLNLGIRTLLERSLPERRHVAFLPLTHEKFQKTPGLDGASALTEFISLRYDTRPNRENSETGFFSEAEVGISQGIKNVDSLGKFSLESKLLWQETSFLNGAARFYWAYTAGHDIPFYFQRSLGGSFLLRGFTEDRFIDKGAWELEIEQRLAFLKTEIFGVKADWRIDPFIALGQVYSDGQDLIRYARISGGLGFRAFVHPNVLGRVDTAIGGDGLKIYVELGYPF